MELQINAGLAILSMEMANNWGKSLCSERQLINARVQLWYSSGTCKPLTLETSRIGTAAGSFNIFENEEIKEISGQFGHFNACKEQTVLAGITIQSCERRALASRARIQSCERRALASRARIPSCKRRALASWVTIPGWWQSLPS